MKIFFFRYSLLSRGGDKMIAQHASHLARCGHDVSIMADVVNTVFELDQRVNIVPMRYGGKLGTLVSALAGRPVADLFVADIIPLAVLLALPRRRNVLYFGQDYDESYYSSRLMKMFIRGLYFLGLRVMKIKTITVARHLATTFRKRFKADSVVVENGVDTLTFFPEKDAELVAANESRKTLLVLSRKDKRKGFDLALKSLSLLPPDITSRLEVWTVGEDLTDEVPNGLKHKHFGYVGEIRLRQLLSSADLFFYPTRHEGFPLMVMEAFACGCPVVTTEAVTYARNRENALVGKVGDVEGLTELLLEVLRDDRLRDKIANAGYLFAKSYTLQRSLEEFTATIQQIVGFEKKACH